MSKKGSNSNIIDAVSIKDSIVTLTKKVKPDNISACSKRKCVDSIEKRLPALHQPNLKREEAWTVRALPTDWEPVSKPSKVIENLLKKRKAQHEEVIKNISKQCKTINLDIEAELRLKSEEFKCEFRNGENLAQKYIETVSVNKEQMLALNKEDFEKVNAKLIKLHDERVANIEEFYGFLKQLEKERSERFKKILKSAYEKVHQICYKLPYELQQYFEGQIIEINKMLLSNLRCYAELHLGLHLRAENSSRLHLQSFNSIKAKWREIKKTDVLMKLIDQKLVQSDYETALLNSEQGRNASQLFLAQEQNMEEIWTQLSPLGITPQDVNDWSRRMEDTVNGLDDCARKLIVLYKIAVIQVFHGYFDELQHLTERMLEMGLIDNSDISILSLEECKPALEDLTCQYGKELNDLESLWNSVVAKLQKKLQTTYVFLNGAAHLWDSHFERVAQVKNVVLKDLTKVINKNDKASQDQEIKLNTIIDTIRQAPDMTSLEDGLKAANNVLDSLEKTYNAHHLAEAKVIEKYKSFIVSEAEVLRAELALFLHKHPKNLYCDPTRQERRLSQRAPEEETPGSKLPAQMRQCEFQVDAVHNWMFGLGEAIERYMLDCESEAAEDANSWVSEHVKKLAKRLEIKMAFHSSRSTRLQINVYEIRLAELISHTERIDRHKAGAEKEVENLKLNSGEVDRKHIDSVEDYRKKIDKINSKLKNAKNGLSVKAYLNELNHTTNLYNQQLNQLSEGLQNEYSLRIYKVKHAGLNLCKQIRMFAEDGNFNYNEAKKLTKLLKSFEKVVKKKFDAVNKEIQTKEKKHVQQINNLESDTLDTLKRSLEEFEFSDEISFDIKNLQADIRNEAYNIKYMQKNFQKLITEVKNQSLDHLGDADYLEDFERNCNDVIALVLQFTDYLYQPPPVVNAAPKRLDSLITEKVRQPANRQSISSTKSKLSEATTNKYNDYAIVLFGIVPGKDNSLMSKICLSLHESLAAIQLKAKNFYERREIVNYDIIQPDYDEFMQETFAKYHYYHVQCEVLWLEQVNEFLVLLQVLRRLISKYRADFIEQLYSDHTATFSKKYNDLAKEIMARKKGNKEILQRVFEKLKTLHGHPKNKHLLEDLKQEMRDTAQRIRDTNVDELMEPFKEVQQQSIDTFQRNLYYADAKLSSLYDEILERLLHDFLIQQFEEKLGCMNILFTEELLPLPEDASEFCKAYQTKIQSISIPNEYETNLTRVKLLAEDTDSITICGDTSQPYEYLIKCNEEHKDFLNYIDDIKHTWNADADYYEKIFSNSVENILKLYVAKYDFEQK